MSIEVRTDSTGTDDLATIARIIPLARTDDPAPGDEMPWSGATSPDSRRFSRPLDGEGVAGGDGPCGVLLGQVLVEMVWHACREHQCLVSGVAERVAGFSGRELLG